MNKPTDLHKSSRIPELDGVRGLAIALVLICHYVILDKRLPEFFANAVLLARSGVDLFFVLSGFLIGGILMDNHRSKNYFSTFYIRRVCRILPLYYLCLVSFALFQFLLLSHSSEIWFANLFTPDFSWWTKVTLTQNFAMTKVGYGAHWLSATWSLAVEEQFYLLLPLVIWLTPERYLLPVLFIPIVFAPFLRMFFFTFYWYLYAPDYVLLPCRADALLMGVVCAYLVRHKQSGHWLKENPWHLRAVFLLLLLGMIYITSKYGSTSFRFERTVFVYSWLAMFYSCLLLLAITLREGIVAKTMRVAPLRHLGMISYCVYLFHGPINGLAHGLISGADTHIKNISDATITIGALVITLLFASFSWRFFEKPIVNWGHSFRYDRPERALIR